MESDATDFLDGFKLQGQIYALIEIRNGRSGMIYIGCHLSVTDGYEAMGHTMSRFHCEDQHGHTSHPSDHAHQ